MFSVQQMGILNWVLAHLPSETAKSVTITSDITGAAKCDNIPLNVVVAS